MTRDNCVFCAIIRREAPGTVLHYNQLITVIAPLNPHAPDHALVLPNIHIASVESSPALAGAVLSDAVAWARRFDSYNLLTSVGADATQTVMHLHIHVIPRGPRDGLARDWPWMRPERTTP